MSWWKIINTTPLPNPTKTSETTEETPSYHPTGLQYAIQVSPDAHGTVEQVMMSREESQDPITFKVENRSQFVTSAYGYFNENLIHTIFHTELHEQSRGNPQNTYFMHCDPAKVNDMFSLMIAHDENNILTVDYMHVYRPEDYENHTINYEMVEEDIKLLLRKYNVYRCSFDQFNSTYLIQRLRDYVRFRNLDTIIVEDTATAASNMQDYERLKQAINSQTVVSYKDDLNTVTRGESLLEAQLCSVQMMEGKLIKPRAKGLGHCDLVDCLASIVSMWTDWNEHKTRSSSGSQALYSTTAQDNPLSGSFNGLPYGGNRPNSSSGYQLPF